MQHAPRLGIAHDLLFAESLWGITTVLSGLAGLHLDFHKNDPGAPTSDSASQWPRERHVHSVLSVDRLPAMAEGHPSRGSTVLGVNGAFVAAAILFTIVRFLTRICIVRDFGPEDWSIGIATVSLQLRLFLHVLLTIAQGFLHSYDNMYGPT